MIFAIVFISSSFEFAFLSFLSSSWIISLVKWFGICISFSWIGKINGWYSILGNLFEFTGITEIEFECDWDSIPVLPVGFGIPKILY